MALLTAEHNGISSSDSQIRYQRHSTSDSQDFVSAEMPENGHIDRSRSHDRHDSSNSAVRVEIADLDERTYTTTGALRRCQQIVMQPYSALLTLVGWRSIGKDTVYPNTVLLRTCNIFYTMLVIGLQLYTFVYQVVACEGKLDINTDTHDPSTTSMPVSNITTLWDPLWAPIGPAAHRRQCYHITTTYIVPAILHFAIYFTGFIHFRLQENEQLYILMEKVFLQNIPFSRNAMQATVTFNARCFLYIGILWSFLGVFVQGTSALAFGVTPSLLFRETWATYVLFALQLVGFLLCYLVWASVIVNYTTHCELLVAYINGIHVRLREKSMDLRIAMHEILGSRESLSMLNGTIARMTGIGVLSNGELTIVGICLLVLNDARSPWVWIYRSIFPVTFGLALLFPLIQAARVSKTAEKLKQICFEMRVFGYKDSNQLELDSFLLFVNHASLRAKLFGVPINPALVMSLVAGIALTLLILFQMGVISGANIMF